MTVQSRNAAEKIDKSPIVPDTRRSSRIPELDGWRAISVLLVIASHYIVLQHPGFLARHQMLAPAIHRFGPLGVSVFFVISGFVICRLLIAEENATGAVSLKGFYYRRAFRILPPFLVYVAAVLILESFRFLYERRVAILPSLAFLGDLNLSFRSWFVGHTWSLAVEEQFYLVFPGAWLLMPSRWRLRAGAVVFLLCALWSASRIYAGPKTFMLHSVPGGFTCICCGVLLAMCEKRARSITSQIPALVVLFLALLVVIHPLRSGDWSEYIFDSFVFPPIVGLVLLYSAQNRGLLGKFLCSWPLQRIGVTSYGIYLWQELFTASDANYAAKGFWIRNGLPMLFVIVPLSYAFIEKPAMRYGRHLSERAKAASLRGSRELIAAAPPGVQQ